MSIDVQVVAGKVHEIQGTAHSFFDGRSRLVELDH